MKLTLSLALLFVSSFAAASTNLESLDVCSGWSCSSNCGSGARYIEVTGKGANAADAFNGLVLNCNRYNGGGILFVQATRRADDEIDYTFATVVNACVKN